MPKTIEPLILMSLEQSTMVSTWNEMLGAKKLPNRKWRIDTYVYDIIGTIDEAMQEIPEAERYDEDGELKIPKVWKGRKVRGLADGEYLETFDLFCKEDGVTFNSANLEVALDWCKDERWDKHRDFRKAWKKLSAIVSQKSQGKTRG